MFTEIGIELCLAPGWISRLPVILDQWLGSGSFYNMLHKHLLSYSHGPGACLPDTKPNLFFVLKSSIWAYQSIGEVFSTHNFSELFFFFFFENQKSRG